MGVGGAAAMAGVAGGAGTGDGWELGGAGGVGGVGRVRAGAGLGKSGGAEWRVPRNKCMAARLPESEVEVKIEKSSIVVLCGTDWTRTLYGSLRGA